MKNICVIGGAGFIGSHIVRRCIKKNYSITVIDDLSRKLSKVNLKSIKKNIKFFKIDISKTNNLHMLKQIFKNTDIIFHCAAQVAVTTSLINPMRDFDVNLRGTMNILEAVRVSNPKAIIFFSSTNKVYGDLSYLELLEKNDSFIFKNNTNGISENYPLNFHTPYGCSKGAADQYFLDYSRHYGLKTIVFRKSCIYGTYQYGVEDQGWISWFVIATLLKKEITIFGDGKQVRDVLYIDDLLDAYFLALKNINKTVGQVFNIGGGLNNSISVIQAIKKISQFTNQEINLKYSKIRQGDQKIYISDNSKAKKLFDWQPKIKKDDGLAKIIEWVYQNKNIFHN